MRKWLVMCCSRKGTLCLSVCTAFLLTTMIAYTKIITASFVSSVPQMAVSVHNVRPSDIGVVAALGDSFSVGYGAFSNGAGTFDSHPEVSFCMGGEGDLKEYITIPNILRRLGASLIGYSTKESVGLNFAFPGAQSLHLHRQAVELVQQFPEEVKSNKWKLLTIFIGLNDMGHELFQHRGLDALRDRYKANLKDALRVLASHLNRTIVSIVSVPNMATFLEAQASASRLVPHFADVNMRRMCDSLNSAIESLVEDGSFERDDFTLVQQPLFSSEDEAPKTSTGAVDTALYASDLLHLSQKGQAMYAAALWNNMLEPVGAKSSRYLTYPYRLRLPNENCPYIRTSKNSDICDGNREVHQQEKFIEI
uniref:Phospholipase B1, membrane-associated n=1 Tax=Parascaris univalens TaxID=6257 RepID=A0A915AB11_PARUN